MGRVSCFTGGENFVGDPAPFVLYTLCSALNQEINK